LSQTSHLILQTDKNFSQKMIELKLPEIKSLPRGDLPVKMLNNIRKPKPIPDAWQSIIMIILILAVQLFLSLTAELFLSYLAVDFVLTDFVISALGNAIVIWLLLQKISSPRVAGLFQPKLQRAAPYLGTLLLFAGFLMLQALVNSHLWSLFQQSFTDYLEVFSPLMEHNIFISFLFMVIIFPLLEEIIYRGIILEGLLLNHGRNFALLFSALIFGLIHMIIIQIIPAFFSGLLLGWLYLKYRSLLLVFFAHAVNNAASLTSYQLINFTEIPEMEIALQYQLLLIFGGLILLGLGYKICRADILKQDRHPEKTS